MAVIIGIYLGVAGVLGTRSVRSGDPLGLTVIVAVLWLPTAFVVGFLDLWCCCRNGACPACGGTGKRERT